MNERIKVKISSNSHGWSFLRQTPESKGIWGNYQFYTDDNTEEFDWWVIIDGIPREQTIKCYPENTILITGEPPSIKKYNKDFTKQFNTIITTQEGLDNKNIFKFQLLPWYIGAHFDLKNNKLGPFTKSYDELKRLTDISKTKLISVISSSKTTTRGHRKRLKFIKILKDHFKEKLDVLGSGINMISDKWDGIAPYRYHVVIENNVYKNYWTEKLADSLLAESYPFYFGCPNIDDYFSPNTIVKIDINKPFEAILAIENAIQNDYYRKFHKEISEAKKQILDRYQIFPRLCEVMNTLNRDNAHSSKVRVTIKPEITRGASIISRISSKLFKKRYSKLASTVKVDAGR
ncbi:MAG: glycosyltransferase family 10 [Candidatus Paceibacterota bacterium]|jgi:hypothetical protein